MCAHAHILNTGTMETRREWQVVMSSPLWVLRIKLQSSERQQALLATKLSLYLQLGFSFFKGWLLGYQLPSDRLNSFTSLCNVTGSPLSLSWCHWMGWMTVFAHCPAPASILLVFAVYVVPKWKPLGSCALAERVVFCHSPWMMASLSEETWSKWQEEQLFGGLSPCSHPQLFVITPWAMTCLGS